MGKSFGFTKSPANQLIGEDTKAKAIPLPAEEPTPAPEGRRPLRFKKKEDRRSQQIHLYVTPGIYEKVLAAAEENGVSVNEYLNALIISELGE